MNVSLVFSVLCDSEVNIEFCTVGQTKNVTLVSGKLLHLHVYKVMNLIHKVNDSTMVMNEGCSSLCEYDQYHKMV